MSKCSFKLFALDEKHSPEERQEMMSHAASCDECRNLLNNWLETEQVVENNARLIRAGTPADVEVRALYDRLAERNARPAQLWSPQIRWKAGAALAGTFALGLALSSIFYHSGDQTGDSDPIVQHQRSSDVALDERSGVIEAPRDAPLLASLEDDRVGLMASSRLLVNKIESMRKEVRVEKGAVAFEVEKREAGEQFVVRAGDLTIRVVGTLFTVQEENAHASVVVLEGVVEVSRDNLEQWVLQMDQKLAADSLGQYHVSELNQEDRDLAALLLPQKEAQPTRQTDVDPGEGSLTPQMEPGEQKNKSIKSRADRLDRIKKLLREGDTEIAKIQLEQLLEKHPNDHRAGMLLADHYQRLRDYEGSLTRYLYIIENDDGHLSNRARFKAARLLADRFERREEAKKLYREFLKTSKGHVLESTAMLGLAEVLIAQGELPEAKTLLQEIAIDKGGTVAAVKARKILNDMESK